MSIFDGKEITQSDFARTIWIVTQEDGMELCFLDFDDVIAYQRDAGFFDIPHIVAAGTWRPDA
jgi:hypothetical protein